MIIDLCIYQNPAQPINERKACLHMFIKKESLLSIDESAPSGDSAVGRTRSLGMMMTSVLSTPEAFSLSMTNSIYINNVIVLLNLPVFNLDQRKIWTLSCIFSPKGYPYLQSLHMICVYLKIQSINQSMPQTTKQVSHKIQLFTFGISLVGLYFVRNIC